MFQKTITRFVVGSTSFNVSSTLSITSYEVVHLETYHLARWRSLQFVSVQCMRPFPWVEYQQTARSLRSAAVFYVYNIKKCSGNMYFYSKIVMPRVFIGSNDMLNKFHTQRFRNLLVLLKALESPRSSTPKISGHSCKVLRLESSPV